MNNKMTKKQIMKLWGVKKKFIIAKIKHVNSIIESGLSDLYILNKLNEHGMDVGNVIVDILETKDIDNNDNNRHNHNHNNNNSHESESDEEHTQSPENIENNKNKKKNRRRPKRPKPMTTNQNVNNSKPNRNRKRKRENNNETVDGEPVSKKRRIEDNNNNEQELAMSMILNVLNQQNDKQLAFYDLSTKVNEKIKGNGGQSWYRAYRPTLGAFDEFVKNNDRFNIELTSRSNFIVKLNEIGTIDYDSEQTMDLDEELENKDIELVDNININERSSSEPEGNTNNVKKHNTNDMDEDELDLKMDANSDDFNLNLCDSSLSPPPTPPTPQPAKSDSDDGEIYNMHQDEEEGDDDSDDDSGDDEENDSDSEYKEEIVFKAKWKITRYRPKKQLAKRKKPRKQLSKIQSKQERSDDSDSDYSPRRPSMKAEADSDSDNESKTKPDIPSIIRRDLVTKQIPTWKTKTFHTFKFKYNIRLKPFPKNAKRPPWFKPKVEPIRKVEQLKVFHRQFTLGFEGLVCKAQYNSIKHAVITDKVALKTLYRTAFHELHEKITKPKKKKTKPQRKKERKDYTVQAEIRKTKEVQTGKYSSQISITLNRFEKTGNCFIVDIPATIALISCDEALVTDIYETINIEKEFRRQGHTETSISVLDFACRYNDNAIQPFRFGKECNKCSTSTSQANVTHIPCGHNLCDECRGGVECPVCDSDVSDFGDNSDVSSPLFLSPPPSSPSFEGADDKKDDEKKDESENEEEEDEDEDMRVNKYELTVKPFAYQIQSIEWMIERENDKEGLYKYLFKKGQFKNGEVFYYSAALNRLVLTDNLPVINGGFLCEEMGLGKTLECLAVIACNKRLDKCSTSKKNVLAFKETAIRKKRVEVKDVLNKKAPLKNEDIDGRNKRKPKKKYKIVEEVKEYTYYKGKGTLIIGPVSLIGQWELEVDKMSTCGLKYARYYGQRSRNIKKYLDYDIVFTTYGILSKENSHDRANHVLHNIEWHRIILDESHSIKNGMAFTSLHINELKAKNKWLLSGTPFEAPSWLENQLRFLGIQNEHLNAMKLKKNQYNAAVIKIVKYMMMRHKKGQQFNKKSICDLPEKKEDVIFVNFDAKQQQYYNKLYATARETFDSYKATDNVGRGSIAILASLHPARQACSGYIANMNEIEQQLSVAQQRLLTIRALVEEHGDKTKKELYELAREEAYNKDGMCVICLEAPPDEPLQTPCRHIFCGECIIACLTDGNEECPICRKGMKRSELKIAYSEEKIQEEEKKKKEDNHNHNHSHSEEEAEDEEEEENEDGIIRFDAKLKVLVSELNVLSGEKPCDKSLVFTSFSKSLDWICSELDANGIKYCTLSGSMPMNKRAKNLRLFATDPEIKVFVLTVRTGAVGLTLTAANHVFMMEPTFNPALHRQAINRVYRLGQEKEVFIHTLIMKHSIEERIWNINKEKQKGDIDNVKNTNMYGNIKEDKAGGLETNEIEKLFDETNENSE